MIPALDTTRLSLPGQGPARRRALLAGAILLAGAAAAAKSDAPPRGAPAEPVAKADKALRDAFALRTTGRTAVGTFGQAAIVAEQKRRAGVLGELTGTTFRLTETRHYLILSDADPAQAALFAKWCEPLYANFARLLGMDAAQRIWDGKCMLILFNTPREFEDFARRVDGVDAGRWRAYYWMEDFNKEAPALLHLCFNLKAGDERTLRNLLAHEGGHAFFSVYQGKTRLPLWLDEGLAEYMAVYNEATLRPAKLARAAELAKSTPSLREFFARPANSVLTTEEYGLVFSLVDCLFETSRPKFKKLIDALKDGKPQEAALAAAYDFDFTELEKRWRAWLTAPSPK